MPPAFVTRSLIPHLPIQKRPPLCPVSPQHPRHSPLCMGRRSEKIKGRKDAQNAARTKIFARIGKMITMAAKAGGPDISANKALADAVDAAKAVSFPKDTLEKAIARATNDDQADFKESSFEAYGYGGAGFYIDVLTDNPNRAAAAIRTALNKSKLKIASPGSVAFNFNRMGVVRVLADSVADADDLLMAAIDAGAEECEPDHNDHSVYRIHTGISSLITTRKALEAAGYSIDIAHLEMVPKTTVAVSERDMELNMKGIDMLQAVEDVDGVYMNAVLE